jgi:hypothetical protein
MTLSHVLRSYTVVGRNDDAETYPKKSLIADET